MKRALLLLGLFIAAASSGAIARQDVRPWLKAPPMGWNSWDAYGFTISEAQFKANATRLAALRAFGWNTAVIDEGWYMANPLGADLAARRYHYDSNGRLVPDQDRFPSSRDGNGLRALAKWTHRQGLKFGIHIIRGIPKAAVAANAPIAGSSFRASQAAVTTDTCPWDDANFGVADNAAGQAWYDALVRQYAGWGVDFLKVDCIADHPYRPTEIRQIAEAIHKTGRHIVLSLSPGPVKLEHALEVQQYAQMWRIMDDLWDGWTFPHTDPSSEFPTGIKNAFDRLSSWNPYVGKGFPDADMLPFGALFPHPGWGDPRLSRLSDSETRTAFSLWAIARSPLILGGNLTGLSPQLTAILTNREVIALNQGERVSHPLNAPGGLPSDLRIWVSTRLSAAPDTAAIFNIGDSPASVDLAWTQLGFPSGRLAAKDLWTDTTFGPAERLSTEIPPHGVVLLRLCRRRAVSC